ncbi:MAG: hypothetical protein U0998_10100 [Moraxellaceae bacterium]|nr:hypothetical protein [Moraxellaceae bacterium]MDZ4387526.1 hypothetical protein [Moraxellaceae bacterium]
MTITPSPSAEKATLQHIQNNLKPLARRRFLKWTLGISASLVAVCAGLFSWRRLSPVDRLPVPDDLLHISTAHYHLFNRLAEILLPTEGSDMLPVQQIPVAVRVDQLMFGIEPSVRKQLLTGLSLFDNMSVIRFSNASRFVDLSTEDATRYMDDWVNSPIFALRAVASAAGRLVKTAYWSAPETWPAIGYSGPVTSVRGIISLGNSPLPEA